MLSDPERTSVHDVANWLYPIEAQEEVSTPPSTTAPKYYLDPRISSSDILDSISSVGAPIHHGNDVDFELYTLQQDVTALRCEFLEFIVRTEE